MIDLMNIHFSVILLIEINKKTEINKKYPIELSKIKPVYEIPEEVTIIIEEKDIKFLGNKSYYKFKDGNIIKLNI